MSYNKGNKLQIRSRVTTRVTSYDKDHVLVNLDFNELTRAFDNSTRGLDDLNRGFSDQNCASDDQTRSFID